MIDFAVDEEVEGRPNYGEIVVDADERVVDALCDFGGAGVSGMADALGEGVGCHLAGCAVAHEDHGGSGDEGLFDDGGVALGHAVEHGIDGSEDGLLFRGLRVERGGEEAGGCCCGEEAGQGQTMKDFHGSP